MPVMTRLERTSVWSLRCLYTFAGVETSDSTLVTEYEQLLQKMYEERRLKLEELKGKKKKKEKEVQTLQNDLKFIEVELHRYQQGMSLFRSKGPPKVGRWGRAETEPHKEEQQ